MRTIAAAAVTDAVRTLCIESNLLLPADMRRALERHRADEPWGPAVALLDDIIENYHRAEALSMPVCQDTGMACVFVRIGQDVRVDGPLEAAIHEGVRQGYMQGFLRKSVVFDPLDRHNTGDNTPALIHWEVLEGDKLEITLAPKGAGSENMSRLKMLRPSDGVEGVRAFVLETVKMAGSNPCPPIVVGVGIGGNFDYVALLAKRALLREAGQPHPDDFYAAFERSLLDDINALGIGPQGLGGQTTALGVAIETAPTHIAQLPCAVNIGCHVNRHQTAIL